MNLRPVPLSCGAVLAAALVITSARAAEEPAAFVERTFREALDVVYDGGQASQPLSGRLQPIVDKYFDMDYATRSAVGRAGWEKMSEEQHRRAVELFGQLVLRTYADRFHPTESRPELAVGKPDIMGTRCEVPSTLTYQGETYQVAYRLRQVGGSWRYYDIVAENVSMLRNYREQFDAILGKSGPDGLIQSLEDNVRNPPPAT